MELEGLFPEHLCYHYYRKDKHIQHNVLFKPGESLLGTHVSYHYDLLRYILSVTWVLCWGFTVYCKCIYKYMYIYIYIYIYIYLFIILAADWSISLFYWTVLQY